MLNFLNSTVLFAAAAALIPLIIHLFSRRRVKVIEFSSLQHLKSMQRRQVKRLKLRQLLLLILRMLIILAVVMAFARPTTKSGQVGSHATVSAVVLLDNSASMDRFITDGNLFDLAKQRTAELLATFGQTDEVLLLPLNRAGRAQVESQKFASAAVAVEQLQTIEPGYAAADMESVLDYAARLIDQAVNLNREIYIVSDRQRNSLPENKLLAGSRARVYLVDLPLENDDNCGVISVDFGGQLIQPGHDFDIVGTVRNYGSDDRSDMIASLFVDGRRVAQTDFDTPAGGETVVRFTHRVPRTGFHSGYIEISDDRFLADNRYYFSFDIPDVFNLLIIAGDNSGAYMSLALVPDRTLSQYWSVKTARPEELPGVNILDYDVILLAGAPKLTRTYTDRFKSFLNRGKALLVGYGGDTDIGYFNAELSELTGVVYDEPVARSFSQAGYYSLQSVDADHPIFSVFGFDRNKPPEIKFFALPKFHLRGDTRTLMRFTGDRPALVETTYGKGKVLCFTGPMTPEYTDLSGHAFFVPFISRIAEYLASDLSTYDLKLFSGENITRSLSLPGTLNYPVDLTTPDSSRFNIVPEEEGGALVLHVKPTDQPGIYNVSYLGREIDRFAINLPAGEGELQPADLDQFAASLGAGDYRLIETGEPIETVIAGFRFGRELWQVFLWLAVLFVILEILLARSSTVEE